MEPDKIDFRDVPDNATRSVLIRLYDFICKVVRAVNAVTPSGPGAWQDVLTGVGFQNGWGNFGGAYATAAYRLEADGTTVRLRGLIAGGASGVAAFQLPAGFRPPGTKSLLFASYGGGVTAAWVQVDPNGNVDVVWITSNGSLILDGITFSTL